MKLGLIIFVIYTAYFTHPLPGYNVIAINWERLATWDNYFTAASNAVRVGDYSAEVLGQLLIAEIGQNPNMVICIVLMTISIK
jgi:hypothetical protein